MLRSTALDRMALSYAAPEDGGLKRLAILAVERATGRRRAEHIYGTVRRRLGPDTTVWSEAIRGLELHVDYDHGRLEAVPRSGPLVVVANHPFGVVDGLILCHLVSLVRGDFKIVAISTLCRVPEVREFVLPINFAETADAAVVSARSRRAARAHLREGGCLIIFPGGAVSTAQALLGPAVDNNWHPFVGRLVMASRAAVLPVYFEGQNSRLFQLVSRFSSTLRLGMLVRETLNHAGRTIRVRVGQAKPSADLPPTNDPTKLVAELRRLTDAVGREQLARKGGDRP